MWLTLQVLAIIMVVLLICSAFSIGLLCQSSTDMKRKTADIAFFFCKGAVRKKKPAETQNDRQGEQIEETDSESEREDCPVSGVVKSQPPGIQTLSLMHLAIVLPSLTMSTSVFCSHTSHVCEFLHCGTSKGIYYLMLGLH